MEFVKMPPSGVARINIFTISLRDWRGQGGTEPIGLPAQQESGMTSATATGGSSAASWRATAIGVLAILLWASLALLTVHARGIPSFELLALSFGVAFLSGLAALAARGGLAQLRQPAAPWLTAFLGIFLYHAAYFFALAAAPAAQASLIAYLWPLLIVILSALASGQALRLPHLLGAALGLLGTAALLLGRGLAPLSPSAAPGYAAAFACAFIWAVYSVANRRFGATPSGMLVGVCGAVAAAGAVCHVALEPLVVPELQQWLAIIALGLGPTGLAFAAWDHATKHGNLPLLGALSYLAPLISTLLLIATGNAAATWPVLAGVVLIAGGAAVATLRPR
jgi:drug/metabolite transporter (DMT)-like permease